MFLTHEWVCGHEKNLCVDDTRLGPTDDVRFGGLWKPVSRISGIFEFCGATLVVFYFLIVQGDYRVLLQLN